MLASSWPRQVAPASTHRRSCSGNVRREAASDRGRSPTVMREGVREDRSSHRAEPSGDLQSCRCPGDGQPRSRRRSGRRASRRLRSHGHPNATTTTSSASSAAPPTPRSSAPSASSPSSGTRTSTQEPEAQERFKEINEAYQVLSDPQRRQRYDMFGRAGVGGGAGGRAASRASAASATSSTPSSAARRRPAPARRGRPQPARTCATTCGSPSRRPSTAPRRRSSSAVLEPLRDVRRQRRRSPAPSRSTCPQCNGRGEIRSVRQTMLGQMVNVTHLPALPGRRQDRRDALPDLPGRGPHRAQADAPGDDPAGIDEGHQIRLSNEGEAGPRGGPPGNLYVAVHVAPHPRSSARAPSSIYEAPVSIAQAALGTTHHGPDRRRRGGGRGQGRAPSPAPRSGCAAGACPTCAGRAARRPARDGRRRGPDQAVARAARAARGVRRRDAGEPVESGGGERIAREARAADIRGRVDGVARGRRRARAWLELSVEADIEAVEAVSEILGGWRPAA